MTQPEALRHANKLDAHEFDEPHAAAAELRRLHQQELANIEWQEKTAWVQKTAKPDELGMHRADVMSRRLGRLKNQRDALLEALRWIDKRCPVALMDMPFHIHREMAHDAGACARAAIKAVEETK